jgi:hypothetical protein
VFNPTQSTASAAQIDANRANSKHSTGPKSDDGKQTSALNGFKHGLTGQRMILQPHELETYRRLTEALRAQYQPETEIENQLVQHVINSNMRLHRIAAIDCNLFSIGLFENTRDDVEHDAATESVIAQTRAWIKQADSFEKLGRYESRISRAMLKYMRELEHVQHLRKTQVPQAVQVEESKPETEKLGSLCTNGQALSPQAPREAWVPVVRVPDIKPHKMTVAAPIATTNATAKPAEFIPATPTAEAA